MKYADLTPELERDLVRRYRAGDSEAARVLQETFERMIWARARKYEIVRCSPADDVGQIIRLATLEALHRFDWSDEGRLLNYVCRWSVGMLLNELRKNSTIVVKNAADAEVRRRAEAGAEIPRRLLRRLALRSTRSLDAPVDAIEHGEDFTLHDVIGDDAPTPDATVEAREAGPRLEAEIAAALAALPERERRSVVGYFMSDEEQTYKSIGRELGISHQAVEQCIQRALPKLHRALRSVVGASPRSERTRRRPVNGTHDEIVAVVLRIVDRLGCASTREIADSARGAFNIDTASRAASELTRKGLLECAMREDDRGLATRHYRLTDAGRVELARAGGERPIEKAV